MNEGQWLSCTYPTPMVTFLRRTGKLSARRSRLFAVAVCRRIWHVIPSERARNAVEVAERYADGEATKSELNTARAAISGIPRSWARRAVEFAGAAAARHAAGIQPYSSALSAAEDACCAAAGAVGGVPSSWSTERRAQADLLRDLWGQRPSARCPPSRKPSWRGTTAAW
jgi:hypothetical protein